MQLQRRGGRPSAASKPRRAVPVPRVRPVRRQPVKVSAAPVTAPAISPSSPKHAEGHSHGHKEDGGALSLLNYAAAFGEALSSTLPASAVSACYAISVGHVLYETFEKCREAHDEWNKDATVSSCDVLCPQQSSPTRRVQGALAERRELQKGMIKLLGTVALPSLVMHCITHSGWDMFTDASGTSTMLNAVADQVAHALHVPHDTIAEMLGKGLPQVAGSFLIPFIARPAEQLVERFMDETLRPAIDEFCSGAQSFTRGASFAMQRDVLARSFAAGRSFVATGGAGQSFIA